MVGLIPLFAVETLEPELLDELPGFKQRLEWFIENRPDLTANVACMRTPGDGRAAAAVDRRRRPAAPRAAGTCSTRASSCRPTASARSRASTATIRTCCTVDGIEHRVDYEPAESTHRPVRRQFQLARADLVPGQLPADRVAAEVPSLLRRRLQGRVSRPARASMMTLWEVAAELSRRLSRIFLRDDDGRRPVFGDVEQFQNDPHWRDLHPRSTSTSTATTARASAPATRPAGPALVAKLLQQSGEPDRTQE